MDNYVEVFDSAGARRGRVEGCLPEAIQADYLQQGRDGRESQTMVPLTVGVGFGDAGRIRVASFHQKTNTNVTVRIRRYALGDGEIEARDFDISDAPWSLDRLEFLETSSFLAFHSSRRELGILRYSLK